MIEAFASLYLPVDEKYELKKNRIQKGTSKTRICVVTGIHGDELRRVRIHELAGNQPGPGPRAPRRVPALHRLWRRNRLPRR